MRLIVTGDRNWSDAHTVYWALRRTRDAAAAAGDPIACLIEGEAAGADLISAAAARGLGIPVEPFPANWTLHHRAAGPIRNQRMLVEGRPTFGLAFHHDLSQSKGTADMVKRLRKAGVDVFNVRSAEDLPALTAYLRRAAGLPHLGEFLS